MDIAFVDIIKAVNRFYGKLFQNELQIMKNLDCAEPAWIMTVEKLLVELQPQIENNTLMLLRLGRHSGAEGVTVEGVRKIKILQGKGTPPKTLDHATTIWLSGDTEKKKKDLIPFGWLLLEIDPQPDSPVSQKIASALRQYNAAVYAQEMKLKEAMFAAKLKQQQVLIERTAQLAEQTRKLAAAEQQQLAEAERLSKLSPEQQQIESLRKDFDELVAKKWKLDLNHKLIGELNRTIEGAGGWPTNIKALLLELAESMYRAANIDVRKNEKVKRRLAILRQSA
jgi:CRISPR-associated protein Csm5